MEHGWVVRLVAHFLQLVLQGFLQGEWVCVPCHSPWLLVIVNNLNIRGAGSSFGHVKQMRQWSFIRMEYCPFQFPFRASRRLEFSVARSPSEAAASRMRNRFSA